VALRQSGAIRRRRGPRALSARGGARCGDRGRGRRRHPVRAVGRRDVRRRFPDVGRRRGHGRRGRGAAGALPRRCDRLPQALQRRASAPCVLRPEGRAAGGRDPADGARPRPRRGRAHPRHGAGGRRPRAVLAERAVDAGGACARRHAPARPARRGRRAGSRRGRARVAERPEPRLRRARRARRRAPPRRRGPRRLDPPDRQRPPERRAPVTNKPPRYASWTAGKLPLPELLAMKARGEKIVMVTAYDAPSARLADAAGVDLLLVGDSSGMVVHGRESTVPVTLEEILFMTQWVARGAKRPIVVADMPFGSYEASNEQAVANAIRLVKEGGADAVTVERAKAIVDAGVAVMGHVGLTPQTATVLGGFKAQGRTADRAKQLLDDALALQGAGCFAIVLEAVPAAVARTVTRALAVPTIGIGAGADTDGQVLVWHDMLGFYEGHAPRFVKRYAELGQAVVEALERYAAEVRSGAFPEERHTYAMPEDERAAFEDATESTRAR